MPEGPYIIAIDQGTTSTRAIVYDARSQQCGIAQFPMMVTYPHPGWVNQDPREIWSTAEAAVRGAMEQAGIGFDAVAAIGITNQRETTVLWDRKTGEPLAPAIVWQSRQSAEVIERWHLAGFDDLVREKTGLVLDPYFSASKIRWLFDHHPDLRARAEAGEVCFGTVDAWLIRNLTGGEHLTDATNAGRTMLFDIHHQGWSDELFDVFDIPPGIVPRVVDSSGVIALTSNQFGSIPIAGCAGDQHAALFGQACFRPGMTKNTYGTGSFLLANTGSSAVKSERGLLTTMAWRREGESSFALEGAVLVSGSAIQWLRDGLGIISSSTEINDLAEAVPDSGGVVFVPALTGLGAPDWDHRARGTIVGVTRGTTKEHIARATLEAIALQVGDVLSAIEQDAGEPTAELRVDGGAARSDLLLQLQADLSGITVRRSAVAESSALGAAWLAGLGAGVWKSEVELEAMWRGDHVFDPGISVDERESRVATWRRAVERSRNWVTD